MLKKAKIIAIAQQKGGTGKTTIAAHIAISLTQLGNKVAVVDIDPQASLSRWYRAREEKLGSGYGGLHLSTKAGWRLQNEIMILRDFDFIIVDSPPHNASDTKTALRDADIVLIPIQPSPTDLWATEATLNFCKNNDIPFCIITNRVTPNSKLLDKITENLPNLLPIKIGNRVAFASSMLDGQCVTETHPSSQASLEIRAVVHEILSLLA